MTVLTLKPPVYLQVDGAEFGPLSGKDVHQFMEKNCPKDQVYAWCKGLPIWTPIQRIVGFEKFHFERSQMFTISNDPIDSEVYGRESRLAPRKPFVASARVYCDASSESSFGICLDVSLQGTKIRIEKPLPLVPGEIVRFELFPLSIAGIGRLDGTAKIVRYQPDVLKCALNFISSDGGQWAQFKARF